MGAIVPLLTTSLVSQGVNMALRQNNNAQALDQLKARQDLQMRQAAQDAALEKRRITIDAANSEDERKKALKRAVARQRASFGSQGVGANAGSSQAVLLGMFEESEADKRRREELDELRLKSIDQELSQVGALNILQREQLSEKKKLQDITQLSTGFVSDLL